MHPKEMKTGPSRDVCTPVFIKTLFTTAQRWKQPKYPSEDEWMHNVIYTVNGILFCLLKEGNPIVPCFSMGGLEDIVLSERSQSPKDKC
jgi:hypothetical protein